MRKKHLVAAALVLVAVALTVSAVRAGANGERDKVPPATTTDAAAHYWNDVAISASATDASGVAYVYYEFDNGVMRVATVDAAPTDATVQLSMVPSDAVTPAPDASPSPQPHKLKDPTSGGRHTLTYWAQDTWGNVGARQTVTYQVDKDAQAPTTTVTGAKDGVWYDTWVRVKLAAQDNGISGVAALVYSVDGGAPVTLAGPAPQVTLPVTADRENCVIAYSASDLAGNVEPQKTMTVYFDTQPPTPKARNATVRKGRVATLRFAVADAEPNGGTAVATIKIRKSNGRVLKTIRKTVAVNVPRSARFRCKLARGRYYITVAARDTAGNVHEPFDTAIARLRVR